MEHPELIGPIVSVLAGITATYLTFLKVKKSFQDEIREEFKQKFEAIDDQMEAIEKSFEKDVDHIKTVYNSEIKNLTEKIEDLREEIRQSTSQLIQLLTRMSIDK